MLQHAKIEAARALLAAPIPDFPDYDDETLRMRLGMLALRRQAEAAAAELIDLIDEIEGDPDLEPGADDDVDNYEGQLVTRANIGEIEDDEPSLGWTAGINQDGRNWHGRPPNTGRLAWAVEDGEQGDDNGIGDAGGIDTDAEDGHDAEREEGDCVPGSEDEPDFILPRTFDFDPNKLRGQYAMKLTGRCMEPELQDGAMILVDADEPPRRGDLVCIYRRREAMRPGECQALVKRLETGIPSWVTFPWTDREGSEIAPVLLVSMNNPAKTFPVFCRDVLAIHKVLGPLPEGHATYRLSREEKQALR